MYLMKRPEYLGAIKSSRNFNNRSKEETRKLLNLIQKAAGLAVREKGETRESREAIEFLAKVFEPYIKKIAGKCFSFVKNRMDFDDILQETNAMFLKLLYRYDKSIASFSYYTSHMLKAHMSEWVSQSSSDEWIPVDVKTLETTLTHPDLDESDKVYDSFNIKILEKEYIQYIMARSEKASRSTTVKEVCLKVFLGSTTCSDLSKELGISYHAVYEVINKIKKELRYFFHASPFSEYVISSTGVAPMPYEYRK
jgi:RNA polymerase sigma factor (sigma-70 family)